MATPKKTTGTKVTRIKATDSKSPSAKSKDKASASPKTKAKAKTAVKATKKTPTKSQKVTTATVEGAKQSALSSIAGYFKGAWYELKQVRWPNRRTTWALTVAVILFSAFFVVLIILLDTLFGKLFNILIG